MNALALAIALSLAGAPALAQPAKSVPTPAKAVKSVQPASGAATSGPLADAAAQAGAVVTDSGLVFKPLRGGKGPRPAATDTVRVHYRGTFPDGREFDSSYKRGEPTTFPLNRVIKCWTEGLQLMAVGSKAQLTCPSTIAYGEKGAGGGEIPPNAVLVFEVELLAIEKS
ncbi:MAG: FKBP-type peptidyl-prolyl cis-trans isomerase [Rubrivivax sp.]